MSWETIHIILSIKSGYKTCLYDSRWFCVIYLWMCIYQYIRLSDNIHIQETHALGCPETPHSQGLSSHFPAGQNYFLPFSPGLWMSLAKVFCPGRVSDVFLGWFLIMAVPPLWSEFPTDTPGTIPVSWCVILASDTKLSPLGPASTHPDFVPLA